MNKKSKRLNLIICGIAFVVMIVYLFFVDDPADILNALLSAKPEYMLLSVGCMMIYWLLESVNLHLVAKEVHPHLKFKDSVTVSMIGQYFNCITPFSSGGQPKIGRAHV